jgi:hypothetical protein
MFLIILSAFLTVSIFFFNLSSDPESRSPPTVRVPVEALNVNAVDAVLILGV